MKAVVFTIFLYAGALGFCQPYFDMVMSVRDEQTDELLDDVWVRFFRGEELIDSDSSGSIWGEGHLKGFWLDYGHKYNFIISKEGYVTKTGEVDLTNPKLKEHDEEIHLSLFVSLFQYCSAGDYDFMRNTPLIKIFVNNQGEQDWDKEYVKQMQSRIEQASHANISETDYKQYSDLYAAGKALMDAGKYKEAKEKLLEAQKWVDCYMTQDAIKECEERMGGLYDLDKLLAVANEMYETKEFPQALKFYKRLDDLFELDEPTDKIVSDRLRYLKMIVKADEFMLKKDLYEARYYYENASYVFKDGDTYANGRIELIDRIMEKE